MMLSQKQIRLHDQNGFSLVELMISVAIGLFLMAGVFTVYVNTRESQRMVEDEVSMLDEARFALEVMSYDLRHAGGFGRINEPELVETGLANGLIADDCGNTAAGVNWTLDAYSWVYAYNDATADGVKDLSGCTTFYSNGDILEVRYALGTPVQALQANRLYLNSDVHGSTYFIGNTPPDATKLNFEAVSNAYYISSYTYVEGDGLPSLRRISIQPGPVVSDELILPGVVDMQIMFGLDLDENGTVDTYADPNPADPNITWSKIRTVQIWLVVRSTDLQRDLNTETNFEMAGQNISFPNDGYRKMMLSTLVSLRNKTLSGTTGN
jgi:type IV pilus assembly protein PilW